ncbi:MAG: dipeptidase [Bacteroidales bacterium]|nr:dipeptidase [Bacteroidales bacterium]
MFVLDSHCDTPSQLVRLRDLALDNDHAQLDFPKMRRGGVDGAFFALYTSNSLSVEQGREKVEEMLRAVDACLQANRSTAALAVSPDEALANQKAGLLTVFLGLENGQPIGDDLAMLDYYYKRGIRYVTLTHGNHNQICDSCTPKEARWAGSTVSGSGAGRKSGVSPFGEEIIGRMNELGLLVDVSHTSAAATAAALDISSKPIIASHSSCQALCAHPRNLPDELIRRIADKGGVVQIAFYPEFLDLSFSKMIRGSGLYDWASDMEDEFIADPANKAKRAAWYAAMDRLQTLERPSWTRIVDHIEHAIKVGGVECMGIGSDFDGICVAPEGLEDCSQMGRIFDELSRRGWSASDIEKIAGGNFLRCWREVSLL